MQQLTVDEFSAVFGGECNCRCACQSENGITSWRWIPNVESEERCNMTCAKKVGNCQMESCTNRDYRPLGVVPMTFPKFYPFSSLDDSWGSLWNTI